MSSTVKSAVSNSSAAQNSNSPGADAANALSDYSNFDLGELDLTTSEIDLAGVEDDLNKFQADNLVKEALAQGLDLRNYSRKIEEELLKYEMCCVADYVSESDSLAALHNEIRGCDSILEEMESMLTKFQGDLGAISDEIQYLQDRSSSLAVKLKNRKDAEAKLADFIHRVVVSDSLASTIMDGEINETFLNQLKILDERLLFTRRPEIMKTQAAQDVSPTLERLKLKSLARIREFLLEKFYGLKKPQTNVQIKQKQLIKYRDFYEFLIHYTDRGNNNNSHNNDNSSNGNHNNNNNNPVSLSGDPIDLAHEIRLHYQETMSKIYQTKFKKYLTEMKKLQSNGSDGNNMEKFDLIANEEGKGSGGLFSHKKSKQEMDCLFVLTTERERILVESDRELIIPHIADKGPKLGFERIFKSSLLLLIDTATSEYDFIVEFFGERMQSAMATAGQHENESNEKKSNHSYNSRYLDEKGRENLISSSRDKALFTQVFSKTVALFYELLENHLLQTNDALSVLILIRLICQFNLSMQHRRIHCLDSVFDRMNMSLWPKFKLLFDLNVNSVIQTPFIELRKGSGGVLLLNSPNFIGLRYADYTAGILKLNKDYNDEILISNLKRFRFEVERLFTRSAARIKEPKLQIIFLINNYNAIVRILNETQIESDDGKHWSQLAQTQIGLYVEEELSEKFDKLIKFVKLTEHSIANQSGFDESKIDFNSLESILKQFNKYWKDGLEQVNNSVKKHFEDSLQHQTAPNNSNSSASSTAAGEVTHSPTSATEILKQVLVQLLLYYRRFQEILNRFAKNKPMLMKELVPIPTILFEIRKYSNVTQTN